jgi:hypothetical protein
MSIDPRTPVLVGYGQVNQCEESATTEPVDLMEQAARAAADPHVLAAVDSIRVVNLLSWRYRTRACCWPSASAPRTPPPGTPRSAATCRSRWSTRPAWTFRPVATTWC